MPKIASTLHKTSNQPFPLIWGKLYHRRRWGEGEQEGGQTFQSFPQIFHSSDAPHIWEETAAVWSELHYNASGLQYATQLVWMGPLTLFTDMSRVMLIKASGFADSLPGRMEGMRVMLSTAADSLGEFSYSPILSDGSSELSMHICSKSSALALFMQHGLFKRWHCLRWGDRGRI